MPQFHRILPSVDELLEDLARDGIHIDPTAARALWDRASIRALTDGGPTERTTALIRRIDADFVAQCFDDESPMSISALMEREDPTDSPRDQALGIDAFQRTIAALGIRTVSSAFHGVHAHTLADLERAGDKLGNRDAGRVLAYELVRRAYMEGTRFGTSRFASSDVQRFYASSSPLSDVLNPAFMMQTPTVQKMRQSILSSLVAMETTIPSNVFKHVYIENQESAQQMRRVSEGAEVPTVKLTVTDRENHIYKYGVALEISDEAVRRVAIDEIRFHAAKVAAQRALDKENDAYDILVAGDGNAGTAATETDISTIGGVAGTVTSTPVFNWLGAFEATGYRPTIAIAPRATKTKVRNATYGSANHPLYLGVEALLRGGAGPEEVDMPPLVARDYAATGKVLATDATQNIGMATEAGGSKTETDRYVKRQVNVMVITDTTGFWVIDAGATKILDVEN
ncbi:MAG: hypothetical protein DYG90_00640 [Chloroflexi bacterium CFX6]|nr:hypothetical protein [Chloroflexi bacterium CFX6]